MKIALTIAGSDSGGGAGIQADLKTFHQFGVFGTSAIAAITAQNTIGVTRWEAVSVPLICAQIEAVATDLRPSAVKSGMLPTGEIITAVAESIRNFGLENYVLDPVMVATSGDLLVRDDAVQAILKELIPLATLVTPNAGEAEVLSGFPIVTEHDMHRAAEALVGMGARSVLIKGGHIREDSGTVLDLLYDGEFTAIRHARISTSSTHGTGCTLSAAIAAQLANGIPLRASVESAIEFVHAAIATAPGIGSGHGPLNHFATGSRATNSRTSS